MSSCFFPSSDAKRTWDVPIAKNPRVITGGVIAAITIAADIFILLAALKILPHGVNAISDLGTVKVAAILAIPTGFVALALVVCCRKRETKERTTRNTTKVDTQKPSFRRQNTEYGPIIRPQDVPGTNQLTTGNSAIPDIPVTDQGEIYHGEVEL